MKIFKKHGPPRSFFEYASPLGTLFIASSDCAITDLVISPKGGAEAFLKRMEDKYGARLKKGVDAFGASRALDRYFSGKPLAFDLPLSPLGTEFELKIWKAIASVPSGETISYAGLAHASGNPMAARAAGTACGANPIPIIIPCHRIIRKDGSRGGYTGGLSIKETLLGLEANTK